jgi:putative ABC transport system permease protein
MLLEPRWAKILRDLTAHKLRTMLVVLSIAVGIFAIVVVMGGRGMLIDSFAVNFPKSNPMSATMFTSDFGDLVTAAVARDPRVAMVEARRSETFRYRVGALASVADPPAGVAVANRSRSISLTASKDWSAQKIDKVFAQGGATWPPARGEVLLEMSVRQVIPVVVGDSITVDVGANERRELRVAGFAHDINAFPSMFTSTDSGFVSMETMGDLKRPTSENVILLTLQKTGLTREQASTLAADIRDDTVAPAGVTVYGMNVPKPGSHFLGDIFKAISVLLLALGVMALALSGFLVVNTVSALLTQQTRQIGVMKAVGGRASQITSMYLTLVTVYGLLAIVVGLPTGMAAATWFASYAGGLLNFGTTTGGPPGYTLALGIAVGLVVPIAAAYIPIRIGTSIPVVRAFNATGVDAAKFGHGLVDRALGLLRGLPRPVALSLRNTFKRKGRLALTLTTLTLASAVVMSVMCVRASMLQTVADLETWWNHDVEVTFAQPVNARAVEAEALGTPGVVAVESWVTRSTTLVRGDGSENDSLFTIGLPADTTFIKPKLTGGRWLKADDTDSVVVNTDIAKDENLVVGGVVKLKMRGLEKTWHVVGVVSGQLMGPVVFANRPYLENALQQRGEVGRTVIRTQAHDTAFQQQVGDRVERRLKDLNEPVSGVRTQKGMRDQVANELGILVTFLVIMATILAAVGVIGLSGTMIINVLESTREIGVMRAIGASHASIYQVFITEGIVIGALSWLFGALLTYPTSYALVKVLENAMGIPLSYVFSWSGLAIWLAIVTAISAVASLLPAFNASQVSVRDAISYE